MKGDHGLVYHRRAFLGQRDGAFCVGRIFGFGVASARGGEFYCQCVMGERRVGREARGAVR